VRTQVGIVGAGAAGLTLARLLEVAGVESVVLEARSREYCEHRIRAGVLEEGTASLMRDAGVGGRMDREGIEHEGIYLQFDGERHHVPMRELTGRAILIYGQTEVVKDLIAARIESGLPLLFEVDEVTLHDIDSDRPRIRFEHDGSAHELECDVVAGCDGFHGISRESIPRGVLRTFERGDSAGLDSYSEACLRRVWRAEHFSYWMTSMLHRLEGGDSFDAQLQLSQLRYVTSSAAAAMSLAENYVGLTTL
jgi:p-hydroxybenzoate 3-monooxygenase